MIDDLRALSRECGRALRALERQLGETQDLEPLAAAKALLLLDRIRRHVTRATAALVSRPALAVGRRELFKTGTDDE